MEWYETDISEAKYPNPVATFPRSVMNREEFRHLRTEEEFREFAK